MYDLRYDHQTTGHPLVPCYSLFAARHCSTLLDARRRKLMIFTSVQERVVVAQKTTNEVNKRGLDAARTLPE